MQPLKKLIDWLRERASVDRYLFVSGDLRVLFRDLSEGAYRSLLSRAVRLGYLERVCRGLYAYDAGRNARGLLLYHAAAYLRSGCFNYLSFESVLSEMGVISQIPLSTIFLMSSGRSGKISCGRLGTIEFVHTEQKPDSLMDQLTYDSERRLWIASVPLAMRDMRRAGRSCDLVDEEVLSEYV